MLKDIIMVNLSDYFVLFLGLISIVITTGIVWRVEKRLDMSYKFFQAAVIIFTLGVLVDILLGLGIIPDWQWDKYIKGAFIIAFTLGVLEMRILIRRLDGEVPTKKKK